MVILNPPRKNPPQPREHAGRAGAMSMGVSITMRLRAKFKFALLSPNTHFFEILNFRRLSFSDGVRATSNSLLAKFLTLGHFPEVGYGDEVARPK